MDRNYKSESEKWAVKSLGLECENESKKAQWIKESKEYMDAHPSENMYLIKGEIGMLVTVRLDKNTCRMFFSKNVEEVIYEDYMVDSKTLS